MTRGGRVWIILNPIAGRGAADRARPVLQRLLDQWQRTDDSVHIEFIETHHRGHAERIADSAINAGADLVVAAGGDGTLVEVAAALKGSGACVGLIPLGTGNDFARALGIPRTLLGALHTLRHGSVIEIDLGVWPNGYFINAAGCGLDAAVAARVNHGIRHMSGTWAYLAALIAELRIFRPSDITVDIDGRRIECRAMLCAVANGISYGGGMRIAPNARYDDGMLDICVVRECSLAEFAWAFPRVYLGAHQHHPKVIMEQGSHVRIEADPPLPVHIDGEAFGATPLDCTTMPRALRMIVPPKDRAAARRR